MALAAHSSDGRAYRSIREVLDLLLPEFPDVTISKIRFLESRGLIEPERTPSGYRKFFPADVDRLRWILKQQSEHFLPLKVIKGRLEQGALFEAELSGTPSLFDPPEQSPDATGERAVAESSEAPRAGGGGDEPPSGPDLVAPAPPVVVASPEAEQATAARETVPEEPAAVPAIATERPRAASSKRAVTEVVFSLLELTGATGATEELVAELLEFNLISVRSVRGVATFDAEAVEVTKLAVEFAAFGIEPRHLKSVRFAAERQALVYAQIVAPLLRQRNAATRERAGADLAQMVSMGAKLYEIFLNDVVREHD